MGVGGGCLVTSTAEPQKVCVAEREEAAETAQAHLDGRAANAMLVSC